MEHFVTIFDGGFLQQGIALHRSLDRVAPSACLWVMCVDDRAYDALSSMRSDTLRPIRVTDVEDDELRRLRSERNRGEYCWTLTPVAPRVVFEHDSTVTRVTYIDADMIALRDPAPLFAELAECGKSVLITEHGWAAEYDQTLTSGRFCVQLVVFERGPSEVVRSWWEARCREWCFDRFEDGKFGDQRYLDDWPTRFPDQVHVLQHKEWMIAPWNAVRFPHSEGLFYHFHRLRTVRWGPMELGGYHLPKPVMRALYEPYIDELERIGTELVAAGVDLQPQAKRASPRRYARRQIARLRRG